MIMVRDPRIYQIIKETIENEGGYVNHPHDRGGPTNYGITLNTLRSYLGYKCSVSELKLMTKEYAVIIYESLYYLKPRIDLLPNEIEAQVFDWGVTSSPLVAVRQLQIVLNSIAKKLGFATIDVDGGIGPKTADLANLVCKAIGCAMLNNAIAAQRKSFYRRIVAVRPSQSVFLRGWLSRASKFEVV
jgi:lysozyme family protein